MRAAGWKVAQPTSDPHAVMSATGPSTGLKRGNAEFGEQRVGLRFLVIRQLETPAFGR